MEKGTMNTLMTLTMMFSLNVIKTIGDCPRYCECKWKSGKESVLCANANMTEIPRYLDSGTQLLDLTGNRLQSIGPDEFFNASLLNLQKIFLSRCRLRFIERSSFRKIINLVELDLSYNELHSVPSHTFEFISELRELRLNGNPIIRVLNNAFKMVPRLTKLDLSECRIGYVEIKAFQGLETSLEWLKLDKNKIVNIKPFALVNLGNLHGLELSGNPWNCSCGLRMLREWMLKQNVPYSIPPVCKYPSRLADKDWDKLDLDEFACVPRIEALASTKEGEEGSNVTIGCMVNGIPNPTVKWLRKNHFIVNLSSSAMPATATTAAMGKPKVYVVELKKEISNLTILAADTQDNGVYVCRAENKAGQSEANITLTISVRPAVRIWSSRMIAAAGVVFLLFALVVALLSLCAWSSRKRKFHFQHSVGGRDYDADGYEMNHKKPINYSKITDYGNHCTSHAGSHTYSMPGKNSDPGGVNDGRIGAEEEDGKHVGDFSTTHVSGFSEIFQKEKTSDSSSNRSDAEERLSKYRNSNPTPDLHIPRLKEKEVHEHYSPCACSESQILKNSSKPTCTMASSSSFRSFNSNIDPRFCVAYDPGPGSNRTFYVETIPTNRDSSKVIPQIREKCPDLLKLSRNTENLINNNAFCTIPRKRSYKIKKNRRESTGSESQSLLIPGSSNDSCNSNFSSNSGRPSLESSFETASFPSSPGNLNQTYFPTALDESPKTLKYKSLKLEKFLKEYRTLQDQLYRMKESSEDSKDENLEFGGTVASGNVQTIIHGNLISTDNSGSTEHNSFQGTATKIQDDNFGSCNGVDDLLEEDNNNLKYMLKSKRFKKWGDDSCWNSEGQSLKLLSKPNGKQTFCQG